MSEWSTLASAAYQVASRGRSRSRDTTGSCPVEPQLQNPSHASTAPSPCAGPSCTLSSRDSSCSSILVRLSLHNQLFSVLGARCTAEGRVHPPPRWRDRPVNPVGPLPPLGPRSICSPDQPQNLGHPSFQLPQFWGHFPGERITGAGLQCARASPRLCGIRCWDPGYWAWPLH